MAGFDDFLSSLLGNLEDLAKSELADLKDAALSDAKSFVDSTSGDLKTWTEQLKNGELSAEDFEFLLLAKKDLAEMEALKQAGLALVRIDKFRVSVINAVVGTATDVFL